MARNLTTGLQRGLRRSVAGGLGAGDLFSTAALDLRFAQQKTLDPRITFTRASSGTYVDSQGVIQRATTNLLLRSEEFDNAAWITANGGYGANAATSPTGTLTADKLIINNGVANCNAYQSATITAGATVTGSVFVKADGSDRVEIVLLGAGNATPYGRASFSAATGAVTTAVTTANGGTNASTATTAHGNGWYRVSVTVTYPATTAAGMRILVFNSDSSNGDGAKGVLLWGAQLEQSSTVGEYIPTTSTINSAPRFDHNPTTGESLGLLVEEQRTNLLLRSEEFDSAAWSKNFVTTTANAAIAPNGTVTADSVVPSSTITLFYTQQNVTTIASTIYTWSVYVKRNGFSWIFLDAYDGANHRTWFDLANGVVGTVEAGNTSTITPVGNDWYRCSLTRSSAGGSVAYAIAIVSGNNSLSGTGNSSNGIYAWGAQLEAGSFPTSYIPTTTAAVTRSADVASITGANFSSWYNQTEGTVFWEGNPFASTETGYFGVQDAGSTSFVRLSRSFNQARNVVSVSSVNQADLYSGNTVALGTNNKFATAIKANDFALSLAGATVVTDTSGTMPTVDRATIGTGAFLTQLNGTIRRLTYWPQRLPNTTLQQITQ